MRAYRLPMEAEWEWACRQGTALPYGCAAREDALVRYANLVDRRQEAEASWPARNDGHVVTAPVGSCAPSDWGLYDLHGNVQEWCWDWYGPYPPGPRTNPRGGTMDSAPQVTIGAMFADGSERTWEGRAKVTRGGAWTDDAGTCSTRSFLLPELSDYETGFRLVSPLPVNAE